MTVTGVRIEGLNAERLDGWLGAVGVLRAFEESEAPGSIRLRWDRSTPVFDLEDCALGIEEILSGAIDNILASKDRWLDGSYRTDQETDNKIAAGKRHADIGCQVKAEAVAKLCANAGTRHMPRPIKDSKLIGITVEATSTPLTSNSSESKNPVSLVASVLASAEMLAGCDTSRWGAVFGERGFVSQEEWGKATRVDPSAPKTQDGNPRGTLKKYSAAWTNGFLLPAISKHGRGYGVVKDGNKSGTPLDLQAPDLVFLASLGAISIPARGGVNPGAAAPSDKRFRTVRWAMPLSLRHIGFLVWHRDLNDPTAATSLTGHESPVRWFNLNAGEGVSVGSPPQRTSK